MQLGAQISFGIFNAVVAIFGTILNSCVIFAILSTRNHRRTLSNTYLLTLATTDLLASVLVAPYFLLSLNLPTYDVSLKAKYRDACKAGNFFIYTVGINRILALTFMSADRYMAILHPFWYQRTVNQKRVIAANLYIILQSSVTNLPMSLIPGWVNYDGRLGAPCGFMWDGKLPFLIPYCILNFGLPLVVLIGSNITVFVTARKQRKRIIALRVGDETRRCNGILPIHSLSSLQTGAGNNAKVELTPHEIDIHGNYGRLSDGDKKKTRKSEKSDKVTGERQLQTQDIIITFSTIFLVVAFLITWLPFAISRTAFVLDRQLFSWHVVVWTTVLTLLNSLLNPLIVLGTRRDIQRTLKDRFKIRSN